MYRDEVKHIRLAEYGLNTIMVMHKIHKASQLDGPGRQAAQSDKVTIDTAGNVYLDSRSQGEIFYYFFYI